MAILGNSAAFAIESVARYTLARAAVAADCLALSWEWGRSSGLTFRTWYASDAARPRTFDKNMLDEFDMVYDAPDPRVGPDFPKVRVESVEGWPPTTDRRHLLYLDPAFPGRIDAVRPMRGARRLLDTASQLHDVVHVDGVYRHWVEPAVGRARERIHVAVSRALIGAIPREVKVYLSFSMPGAGLVVDGISGGPAGEEAARRLRAAIDAAFPRAHVPVVEWPAAAASGTESAELLPSATRAMWPVRAFLPGAWDDDED